jgi:GWxTD domain-containing protein
LALALMIGSATARAAEPDDRNGPGPLPWRVGGRLGFTVDAAAFPDSAGEKLEIYLRLPPSTLASLEREEAGGGGARLKVTARLRNQFGALHHEAALEFAVAPEDTGGFGKVVLMPFPVRSGHYELWVRLEDLHSRKRGLAYVGRRVAEAASVEGGVDVPATQGVCRLSDIEFVWGQPSGTATAFRRGGGGEGVLPNPERLYGLLATELGARFVAVAKEEAPWRWKMRVLDAAGQVFAERESTAAASRTLSESVSFDMSTAPAGRYDCELQVSREGDRGPLVRHGRFSIAWHSGAWLRNPRDIEDDVHFLLESEDEEAFARMSPGEQERYLEDFWRDLDPTPATAENEIRTEFFKRIDHANQTWTRSALGKGMFTDMGRVYIRHGEPDETLRQVIPAGDQTLNNLLQELAINEDRPTGSVDTKGLGGDVRPFEVWVYEGARTRPITARPDPSASEKTLKRLLFLFVDERGYGDFRLRYSTE